MSDQRYLDLFAAKPEEWATDDEWHAVYDGCESPIERRICVEISRRLGYAACGGRWENCADLDDLLRKRGAVVFGQQWIGHYRADFLIAMLGQEWHERAWCAVECDGHEFHSSHEAQYRDSIRDRYFLGQDIPVIRFSGHEIVRRAAQVMGRVPERIGAWLTDEKLWHHTQRELTPEEVKFLADSEEDAVTRIYTAMMEKALE